MINEPSRLYAKLWLRSSFRSRKNMPLQDPLDINRHAWRVFSQHREDGIIDFLLGRIRHRTWQFVEFGFAPDQCNTTNLLVNQGYGGLLMDGGEKNCRLAQEVLPRFTKRHLEVRQAFLNLDNLNTLVGDSGVGPEVDLLSIDVDGNDLWFWQAINIRAAVVVIEYNASLGPERPISVPYDPEFVRYKAHPSGFYHGASLSALTRVGKELGYALVGTDSSGVNAFYVRRNLLTDDLPERTVDTVFRSHRSRTRYKKLSQEEQYRQIINMPYEEIN